MKTESEIRTKIQEIQNKYSSLQEQKEISMQDLAMMGLLKLEYQALEWVVQNDN